jgi:hypothetical protein
MLGCRNRLYNELGDGMHTSMYIDENWDGFGESRWEMLPTDKAPDRLMIQSSHLVEFMSGPSTPSSLSCSMFSRSTPAVPGSNSIDGVYPQQPTGCMPVAYGKPQRVADYKIRPWRRERHHRLKICWFRPLCSACSVLGPFHVCIFFSSSVNSSCINLRSCCAAVRHPSRNNHEVCLQLLSTATLPRLIACRSVA